MSHLPPWPQLPGVFCQGKHFHPRTFLEAVEQVHDPALEQEAFIRMLIDRLTTLESGTVLFKLYDELEIDGSTSDTFLQEHWVR
ncbi:hypothetical protein M405DRAFT_868786 [Rhizopogon salebrosus TDB-379]|nr:hypothetical protein M405DRAFT_868786 [Rhizopogon salebrosus TDB-379]